MPKSRSKINKMKIVLMLLVLCSVNTIGAARKKRPRACDKADVGFLLDVSKSIGPWAFDHALQVIQGLVVAFEVNPGSSRAGLVTFSDDAKTRIEFGKFPSGKAFNREVRNLRLSGRRANIHKGLKETTKVLYNEKYNPQFGLKKYLFVITNGRQSKINRRRVNLKILTRLLRHQNVHIIAIAIGSWPRLFYIEQLVQFPEREVIVIRQRSRIEKKVNKVHDLACSKLPTVPVTCVKRADFAFLLDQSSSIGSSKRFRLEKRFVKDVVKNFEVADRDKMTINVAVIAYATTAELKIKLGEYDTAEKFYEALDKKVRFQGGLYTRIDRALTLVDRHVFNGEGYDRPDAPNYVVLLTDGIQNSGDWRIDNALPEHARRLWKKNVTIFAIGVARANKQQLYQLAGKTGKAIYRKRLEDLKYTVNHIIPSDCLGCHKEVNLGFVIDSSGTAKSTFYSTKLLVHYIIEGFKTQKTKANVCAVRFSTGADVAIHFDEFQDLRNFQVELDTNMPFVGGSSYIYKGLLAAEREFDANGDKNLPKVLIVLTDGLQTGNKIKKLKSIVDRLRSKGFHIVAVSVGRCRRWLCREVFKALAGNEKYIIRWQKKSHDIIEKAELIARRSCPEEEL